MYIVPSEACPENIIRDSFHEYPDKQKRPVLGLFCHFRAKKPIIVIVSGTPMVKSGLCGHPLVEQSAGHMGTVLLFLSPLFFSVSRYGTFRFMTQAKAFAILKSASLK